MINKSPAQTKTRSRKVIIITRRTRFEDLVALYNTEDQAAFVIESRGDDFNDYRAEHITYQKVLKDIEAALFSAVRIQMLEREFLPNFIFGKDDIVIVVGQDGLVANTVKYLNGQPIIAINPEPSRYDGILLPFLAKDIKLILADVIKGINNSKAITMAKATLNDGQELLAVNDIFIGPRYHTSARYELNYNGQSEQQLSSGIIVSTGLGSTGWLASIVAGAQGVVGTKAENQNFAWDANYLKYAVREPFPSNVTGTKLIYGKVSSKKTMTVASRMANNGVIFSDGMIDDTVEFNSGAIVELGIADRQGQLVI
ncbi:MAG: sugar kinase [Gammaproteobacteria bacterium]